MSNCSTCKKSQVLPTVFPCIACVEIIDGKPVFKLWESKTKPVIDVDYEMSLTEAYVEMGGLPDGTPIGELDNFDG